MKKRVKQLGVIIVVLGTLYGAFLVFAKPNGFTSENELILSFAEHINETDVCVEHFNEETMTICNAFIAQIEDHDVVFKEAKKDVYGTELTFTIDDIDISFAVTFSTYEPSGLRARLNDEYYLFDTIR